MSHSSKCILVGSRLPICLFSSSTIIKVNKYCWAFLTNAALGWTGPALEQLNWKVSDIITYENARGCKPVGSVQLGASN